MVRPVVRVTLRKESPHPLVHFPYAGADVAARHVRAGVAHHPAYGVEVAAGEVEVCRETSPGRVGADLLPLLRLYLPASSESAHLGAYPGPLADILDRPVVRALAEAVRLPQRLQFSQPCIKPLLDGNLGLGPGLLADVHQPSAVDAVRAYPLNVGDTRAAPGGAEEVKRVHPLFIL